LNSQINRFHAYVCTPRTILKSSFRAVNSADNTQLFFHISEVLHPACDSHRASDLRNILKSGDEVRFVIEPSQNEEGKLHAKKVKKLEAGTINPEEEDPVVRRGILRSDNNGDLYISPSEEDAKLDENSQPIKKLKFSRHRHMKPGSKPPKVDDVVEFNVVIDKIRNRKRAKNIEVIAEAPNEQSMQGRNVVCLCCLRQGNELPCN
jgi:cold shock CspA family protein